MTPRRRPPSDAVADLDPYGTPPLFPEPPREHVKAAETLRDATKRATPSWHSYGGRRVACDECITYLHEHDGRGPQPRSARRIRTLGKQQWRLCQAHARPREDADKAAAEQRKAAGR